MESNWKSLPNFSRYLISNSGIVFNKVSLYVHNQQVNDDGYLKVALTDDDGKRKKLSVHRLVGILYVDNHENKETVNHIDGIKNNNFYTNLEWSTRSEQTKHAWDNHLIKDMEKRKNGIRNLQGKPVICKTTGEVFRSIGEAAEVKGLKKANISAVCLKKKEFKSAGKSLDGSPLIWEFYEQL